MNKKYESLDGLRTIACIGIIAMHMRANLKLEITGFLYDSIISSFTNFVFLFMTLSAFGMSCGYFDKLVNKKIDVVDFYKKRYKKILPFFAILVAIDLVMSFSVSALIEGFADVTLLFGLFPNDIEVIGVGWFLGVVFAFYIMFPFFCFIISNKVRAWSFFAISIVLNIACSYYFEVGRQNIIYCFCFFLLGGLIFIYRDKLTVFSDKFSCIAILLLIGVVVLYYIWGVNVISLLLVSLALVVCGLKDNNILLNNKITKFVSDISFEIYLSHMVIFRALQKLKIISSIKKCLPNECLVFLTIFILVLAGTIIFSLILKKVIEVIEKYIRILLLKGDK